MIVFTSQADRILKMAEVLSISAVKFLVAPLYSLEIGYSYLQTILYTTIGGVLGIFFFFYLSGFIIKAFHKVVPMFKCFFMSAFSIDANGSELNSEILKNKKTFTLKNKILAKIKFKYGYPGIIILTPVILSIPIGSFLAKKYYSEKKNVIMHLALSVIVWTLVLSTLFAII